MFHYEVFEKLCTEKEITPYVVAKETGVSNCTLSAWKLGKYVPKVDKIKKIADFFEVSIECFM